jgi:hypothetical protein
MTRLAPMALPQRVFVVMYLDPKDLVLLVAWKNKVQVLPQIVVVVVGALL